MLQANRGRNDDGLNEAAAFQRRVEPRQGGRKDRVARSTIFFGDLPEVVYGVRARCLNEHAVAGSDYARPSGLPPPGALRMSYGEIEFIRLAIGIKTLTGLLKAAFPECCDEVFDRRSIPKSP